MVDIPSWARDDEPKTNTATAVPSWAADAPAAPDPSVSSKYGTLGPDGQRHYAAAEVPNAASANAVASGDRVLDGFGHILAHPVDAATELATGAWGVAKGLMSKAGRVSGLTDMLVRAGKPQNEADLLSDIQRQKAGFHEKTADAAGTYINKRYGVAGNDGTATGMINALGDNWKRTMAEDPMGFLADASNVFIPGGVSRAPVAAPRVVVRAADAAAIRPATELLSGVSSEAQQIASRAGSEGGLRGQVFRNFMREPDYTTMQDTLRQGTRGATFERNAAYNADMAPVRANTTPVSYNPIHQALRDADAEIHGPGGSFVKNEAAVGVLNDLSDLVARHWLDPSEPGHAMSMDALKQAINEVRVAQPENSLARRVAQSVYDATGNAIRRTAPEYDTAMRNYRGASRDITEITKSLGAGENATRFSTTGKLLSALRSDASVARGARADALDDVSRHAPTLPYQIAGATMNTWKPRGIVARGSAVAHGVAAAATGAAFMPQLLAALPLLALSSPRLVGNVRYGIGAANRMARRAGITHDSLALALEAARQQQNTEE